MTRLSPLLLLLVTACIETNIGKIDEDSPVSGPDDTAQPSADDSTHPNDSAPSVDTGPNACDDTPLAPEAVEVITSCEGQPRDVDFTLLEADSAAVRYAASWTLAAGRFGDGDGDGDVDLDDPMHLLLDIEGVILLDHTLSEVDAWAIGSWRAFSTLADVDGRPGVEAITSHYERSTVRDELTVQGLNGEVDAWLTGDDSTAYPWLIDIDGDGALDALLAGEGRRLSDGQLTYVLADYDPRFDSGVMRAADLDLDGAPEVIAITEDGRHVGLYDATGERLALCYEGPNSNLWWAAVAIGDLDGDPEGEFAAAGGGFIVTCDSDGSLLQRATISSSQPALLGLAQLDGDPAMELVYSDQLGVTALDDDLTRLWSHPTTLSWAPYSLADFDADGLHEVVTHHGEVLEILNARGRIISSLTVGSLASWRQAPIIADIDADGLAEIVVYAYDRGAVIVDNAQGGWELPAAQHTWPGAEHYPGDRAADGSVPAPFPWWQEPSNNVWQGLPFGAHEVPELEVSVVSVCVESCSGDTVVQVRVANLGAADARGAELRVDDTEGAPLSSEVLPTLVRGVAHHHVVRLPAASLKSGFSVHVDDGDHITECLSEQNAAAWTDTFCD